MRSLLRTSNFWRHATIVMLCLLSASPGARPLAAQFVLSSFAGSVEKGTYEVDYDALLYPTEVVATPSLERVEGKLSSRIYTKPSNKSNLEVFRSYERELGAAGFETVVSGTPSPAVHQMVQKIYGPLGTHLANRSYETGQDGLSGLGLTRIFGRAEYYLVASRTQRTQTTYVALVLSMDQDLYMIDELTTTAMETGTVTLNLERMTSEILEYGKIAVYDIHFATGSAEIQDQSADALGVIATYLQQDSGDFYIVGHTDDTGSLDGNLTLSEQRAAAVKAALVTQHGVAAGRLSTRGVGPLSPVSTNADDAGRALNRRVEIVQRLGDR